MICPCCGVGIRLEISDASRVQEPQSDKGAERDRDIAHGFCSECGHLIILLREGRYSEGVPFDIPDELIPDPTRTKLLYPRRKIAVPTEVPDPYKSDIIEAAAVIEDSPRASAALSRRLLQQILREHFSIKERSLEAEIEVFIRNCRPSGLLAQQVDAIRNVGNFASHPIKNTSTGEIVDVEPGEADWLIETLRAMLEFAFVEPMRVSNSREKLNAKLAAAGKPPMK